MQKNVKMRLQVKSGCSLCAKETAHWYTTGNAWGRASCYGTTAGPPQCAAACVTEVCNRRATHTADAECHYYYGTVVPNSQISKGFELLETIFVFQNRQILRYSGQKFGVTSHNRKTQRL